MLFVWLGGVVALFTAAVCCFSNLAAVFVRFVNRYPAGVTVDCCPGKDRETGE